MGTFLKSLDKYHNSELTRLAVGASLRSYSSSPCSSLHPPRPASRDLGMVSTRSGRSERSRKRTSYKHDLYARQGPYM